MHEEVAEIICQVCQSPTDTGEYYRYCGMCICPHCVEDYTYYADPVNVCKVCGEVISAEKYLVLYHRKGHSCICGSCLAKMHIRGGAAEI